MILVDQEQARDLHQRTSCSVSSFQVPHVPQCWFVIQFYREKNEENATQYDQCLNSWYWILLVNLLLLSYDVFYFHRDGDKDVEWVHKKADWLRVWEERERQLQLLLHMTKTSTFKRLFPPWKEKILSQFLFQISKHCKNCECCSVSTFALCMS